MRFEVPQFIEVEDKIFGPFTWKQFVYLAGGAGAAFILFLFFPFFIALILAAPVAALVAALAFYPVNNRPFAIFLESVTTYFTKSRLYLWKKRENTPVANTPATSEELYTPPTQNTLASLSRKLEVNALEKK